jgi:hypothetical protein
MEPNEKQALRLEWIDPAELEANPLNFRRHPVCQREAITDVIDQVGWASALLFNERTGRLIDGHLRKETYTGKGKVPVLIGSWSEEQEKVILATLDPIAGLASVDATTLNQLLHEIDITSPALMQMLDELATLNGIVPGVDGGGDSGGGSEDPAEEKYQILVDFDSKTELESVLRELKQRGLKARRLAG